MFIVRVDLTKYLVERDHRELTISEFPSRAQHFDDYAAANLVAQQIRRRGYPQSIVCDIYGVPVSRADLARDPRISEERERWFWSGQ